MHYHSYILYSYSSTLIPPSSFFYPHSYSSTLISIHSYSFILIPIPLPSFLFLYPHSYSSTLIPIPLPSFLFLYPHSYSSTLIPILIYSTGSYESLLFLLKKGCIVNVIDRIGITPLHLAARNGLAKLVILVPQR